MQHEAKEFPLPGTVVQQIFMRVVKIYQGIWFALLDDALPYGFGKNAFGAEMVMDGSLGNSGFFGNPLQPETMIEILAGNLLHRCGNDPLSRHIRLAHKTPLYYLINRSNDYADNTNG